MAAVALAHDRLDVHVGIERDRAWIEIVIDPEDLVRIDGALLALGEKAAERASPLLLRDRSLPAIEERHIEAHGLCREIDLVDVAEVFSVAQRLERRALRLGP